MIIPKLPVKKRLSKQRHVRQTLFLIFLSISCVLLTTTPVWSATADSQIILEADQLDLDEKNGISTYKGNVKMTRGQLNIQANTVTAYKNATGLQKMQAEGSPAIFTKSSPGQQPTRGQADTIDYDAVKEILTLKTRASLQQSNNQFSGNLIIYNILNESVTANKGSSQQGRVKVIIQQDK